MHEEQAPRTSAQSPVKPTAGSPLSLNRLREAFAAMLGQQPAQIASAATAAETPEAGDVERTPTRSCEVNPRTLTEAILFVGRPDNGPLSAREMAAAMR